MFMIGINDILTFEVTCLCEMNVINHLDLMKNLWQRGIHERLKYIEILPGILHLIHMYIMSNLLF